MKIITVVAFLTLTLVPLSQALADSKRSPEEIRLLTNSAAALRTDNPSLANRLTQYANKETKEKNEWMENSDIQLLRDASESLKETHPALAKDLNKYADDESKEQEMSRKKMKGN